MKYHVFDEDQDGYAVAILIKETYFDKGRLKTAYVNYLKSLGLDSGRIIAIALPYPLGKITASKAKEYLKDILVELKALRVSHIYCADATYYKALTNQKQADAMLGYMVPVTLDPTCADMQVTYGINYNVLTFNPEQGSRLLLSLQTLYDGLTDSYTAIGEGIIHSEEYPLLVPQIRQALQKLHQYPELSVDIEAFSLHLKDAFIATIGFAWDKHNGIAFPCDYEPIASKTAPFGRQIINKPVRKLLREFFESYTGKLKFHNGGFDIKNLILHLWMKDPLDKVGKLKGLEVMFRLVEDTMIIAYLALNSCAHYEVGLKALAHPFAGNYAESEIKDITKIATANLLRYNLVDCLSTNYVYEIYQPRMVADGQETIYKELLIPSLKVITQIELTGMPINMDRVLEVERILTNESDTQLNIINNSPWVAKALDKIKQQMLVSKNSKLKVKQHTIDVFDGINFNPNSPLQVQVLLYDIIGFNPIDFTDTKQPATGGDTLKKLRNFTKDPSVIAVLNALIDYSSVQKILSSFIPAFKNSFKKGDNWYYLHGSFRIGGTVSGRLSSSNPNMQNIPSGSKWGKLIKTCFSAPEGHIFCGADFNSLEDYVSALTTKDPNKLKVYLDGYDGHCLRAYYYFKDEMPDIQMHETGKAYKVTYDDGTVKYLHESSDEYRALVAKQVN